ncbi:hypothetical protein [Streptomyces microflavus]|uniref:hypothetical protein n=1 Tax=Streptomyces microflavus TaxID=1919 RepID=UPI00368A3573
MYGVDPGGTVEAALTELQERVMVEAGHLEVELPDYPDDGPADESDSSEDEPSA